MDGQVCQNQRPDFADVDGAAVAGADVWEDACDEAESAGLAAGATAICGASGGAGVAVARALPVADEPDVDGSAELAAGSGSAVTGAAGDEAGVAVTAPDVAPIDGVAAGASPGGAGARRKKKYTATASSAANRKISSSAVWRCAGVSPGSGAGGRTEFLAGGFDVTFGVTATFALAGGFDED